ncbi:MAG TPA: tetratricopeptide repeat protein [Gemmatimonadaceae bacterium]|nr:tetratricopeptide repeat protein [Gemmatimonadaceae bacterium]
MFRLRVYGGLTLERDGTPYAGPATQRRRLAVLAMIAASETGVSRERLADYLWPDADPTRGRHSLDDALSGLRRELRSEDLFIGVATLRLNHDAVGCDVADQAAAIATGDNERAATFYVGPFLDGFHISAAPDFERWAEAERGRRSRAQARLLERLATDASARNEAAVAARWWQARVALDPLDTLATIGLLRALATAGNPAEAVRLARVHEALLRNELDANPGPEWETAIDGLRAELARPRSAAAKATAPLPITTADVAATSQPAILSDANRMPPPPAQGVGQVVQRRLLARSQVVTAVGALAVLASFVMWTQTRARQRSPETTPARASVRRGSVAVLPFANTSGDTTDEHFSDGLTDELIGTLSKVPGLKVTGHTSAFALKDRYLTVRTIGDTLGVATVLEGSVRRAGDRLKIAVQLVSVDDNGVMWSEAYDRNLRDVFAVQEEIARAIASALSPTFRDRTTPIAPIQARDLATYELYLEGRYFLARRTADDLHRAAGYFERAIARDAAYAQAYAGLADAHMLLVLLAEGAPREDVPLARMAAATAIRLDSTLAEAHATLGNIHEAFDWDAAGADRESALAIALDPSYATARLYRGINLVNRGRFEEAIVELTQARMLDPLSAPVRMQLGRAYVAAHRTNDAIAVLRAAIELNPQFAAAHAQLGEAYLQRGHASEALAAFRRAVALSGARDSANLAYALAMTGDAAAAKLLLRALLAVPQRSYLPPVPVAKAYVALNDADAAFGWLKRGRDEHASQMRTIRVTPGFDRLHSDPRWEPLLRQIGLEPR